MCGRFALRLGHGEIRQLPGHPGVDVDEWINEDEFVPRYNIAPHSQAPVLLRHSTGAGSSSQVAIKAGPLRYKLHTMKWGLVPHWSKFEDKTLSTTNARSENLVDGGGMWATIKGKKRCAVVCQGYYEWLTKGKNKLPHFTKHRDSKIMLMAGLYDCVVLEGQTAPLWTFTIVTTAANKDFAWLHDRQPVILSTRAALDSWLDTSSLTWTLEHTKLVEPYHDLLNPLECYQVPKEIGKVGTESATFIEPIANRKDGIQAMFSKQASKATSSPQRPGLKRLGSPTKTHDLTESPSHKKLKMEYMPVGGGSDQVIMLDGPPLTSPTKTKREPAESLRKPSPIKRKLPNKTKVRISPGEMI